MSQPIPYSRAFSFTNFQASNPTTALPGSQVDLELNNAKATLDAVLANLALIQRDDGGVKNASIGLDQLKAEVPVGFNAPVVWVTGAAYTVGSSTVFQGSGFYRCLVTHTSGVFATDLAAGKWQLIVNLTAVPLVNASQIAVTPSGSLTTDAQTSLQALDTGKAPTSHTHPSSAISDSTTAGRALLTAADVLTQQTLLGLQSIGFQSGDIKETACPILPTGWYYCDGSAKNRVTDAALFNAISIQQTGVLNTTTVVTGLADTSNLSPGTGVCGTGIAFGSYIQSVDSASQITLSAAATIGGSTPLVFLFYGIGDGSTTFNLPNRAYIGVGRDNAGGSAANVTQVSTTISLTSGSNTATVVSATNLFVGMRISTPKVPFGTTIAAISGTTITMSANATATVGGVTVRFSPLQDAQTLGMTGGELGHVDSVAEMPSHGHTAASASTDSGHTHGYSIGVSVNAFAGASAAALGSLAASTTGSGVANITTTTTITASGGGLPHNNQPKSIVMNYIIKR